MNKIGESQTYRFEYVILVGIFSGFAMMFYGIIVSRPLISVIGAGLVILGGIADLPFEYRRYKLSKNGGADGEAEDDVRADLEGEVARLERFERFVETLRGCDVGAVPVVFSFEEGGGVARMRPVRRGVRGDTG